MPSPASENCLSEARLARRNVMAITANACGKGCFGILPTLVSKWQRGCYEIWKGSVLHLAGGGDANHKGDGMREQTVRLGPREQQIVELLLQGCDNAEIAQQLNIARRTVKAHFNRLFLRFGITSGIKRVKLATLLYRRQLCLEANATENVFPTSASNESLNSWPRDSRTAKLQLLSEPLNTSS